ncbi:MAG: hypothetical protein ABIW84_02730, partial [Ilumatobacteraceae bacterium]
PEVARRTRRRRQRRRTAAVLLGAAAGFAMIATVRTAREESIVDSTLTGVQLRTVVAPVNSRVQVSNGTTSVDVTTVPGALGPAEVVFLAAGLSDPAVIVPDVIIRYSDGKLGLSWQSPCNRPALAVAVTDTETGAVVELTTGGFGVLSCIGMPQRWSAVIDPSSPLPEGAIVPVDSAGAVVTDFRGYLRANAAGSTSVTISDSAGYASALVDDGSEPWVYGVGCSSRSARYQSPIGAIYEVRTETADPTTFSDSDEIVCNNLATRPLLAGPRGAIFPHPDASADDAPIDCEGPLGSQTEVPSQRPYNSRFYDGDWSTWDGCLVRTDVIFSESLFETCAGADLRTITFAETIGERIDASTETLSYIRDPNRVARGDLPPLVTYRTVAPRGIVDTGLRFGEQALWLGPDSTDAIYIRTNKYFERWPRLTESVNCT